MMTFFIFQENLRSWLLDQDCNDQYSVIHGGGDKVGIMWNTPQEPILAKERMVSFYPYSYVNLLLSSAHCGSNSEQNYKDLYVFRQYLKVS